MDTYTISANCIRNKKKKNPKFSNKSLLPV